MEDRRKYKRWPRRVRVRYWARGKPDKVFSAYTRDISDGGTFLQTNSPFRKDSRVQIEFVTSHGGFLIEGQVARSISYPRELQQIKTGGMGVRFVPLRELIGELMPSATSTGAETGDANDTSERAAASAMVGLTSKAPLKRRRSVAGPITSGADSPIFSAQINQPKFSLNKNHDSNPDPDMAVAETAEPEGHTLSRSYLTDEVAPGTKKPSKGAIEFGTKVLPIFPVRFESLTQFLEAFEKDLRFGGLFVSTDQPARLNETVELKISLPESDIELLVQAQVVHVMEPNTGDDSPNLLAGMGVYFSDSEAIERLTKYAESQQAES